MTKQEMALVSSNLFREMANKIEDMRVKIYQADIIEDSKADFDNAVFKCQSDLRTVANWIGGYTS